MHKNVNEFILTLLVSAKYPPPQIALLPYKKIYYLVATLAKFVHSRSA